MQFVSPSPRQHAPVTQAPGSPPATDYLLVPRSTMAQILQHITVEQDRFPARRLRQAMRIVQHLLNCRTREQ